MTESYRLVGRLKNNRLWSAIVDQWPDVTTQGAAAEKFSMTKSQFGKILNMQEWPWSRRHHAWRVIARRMADRLGLSADYLFDADLYGVAPAKVEVEFSHTNMAQLQAAEEDGEMKLLGPVLNGEQKKAIRRALYTLTLREERVIRERFGIGRPQLTQKEVANGLVVSTSRVHQIEGVAIRKLRHPSRSMALRPFVEDIEAEYSWKSN